MENFNLLVTLRKKLFLFSLFISSSLLFISPVIAQETQTVTYQASEEYIQNHGIGWQYMSSSNISVLPESVSYIERSQISWKLLNPSEGVYNWSLIDSHVNRASSLRKQTSFRVYTMRGESFGTHQVPDWVIAKGAKILTTGEPDYANCTYQDEWTKFVQLLRARYDGNPNIAFIDISGYGNFNEWSWQNQTEWDDKWAAAYANYVAGKTPAPTRSLFTTLDGQARRRLADAFAGGTFPTHQCRTLTGEVKTVSYTYPGFQKTQLIQPIAGVRQSTQYARVTHPKVGFRYDCLGRSGSTAAVFKKDYGEFFGTAWRTVPVIFELCSVNWSDAGFLTRAKDLLQYAHGTLVHDNPNGSVNAIATRSLMRDVGYKYTLKDAVLPKTIRSGQSSTITLNWQNTGYAKNYPSMGQKFVLRYYLLDANNNEVFFANVNTDIEKWLPAETLPGIAPVNTVKATFTPSATLVPGQYKIAVNIINARNSRDINLAMQNKLQVGAKSYYIVGGVELVK
jgi:hypothetical protein